jgi:Ca2+-binding EF-hand superfamily protein
MSTLKDNSLLLKKEIKKNFELFSQDNNGIIETEQLNDFLNSVNSKKTSPFLYNSIKTITTIKKKENEEGISPEEFISFIDNQLNDDKSTEGLKNIFNVFCDSNTGNISWNTFPLIAKELGDNETAEKLLNVIKQSKIYTKDLNFKEFYNIMNSDNDKDNNNDNNNDNDIIDNNYSFKNNDEASENNNFDNLNINEYLEDYEEKPTYKQRKLLEKQYKGNESDITSSSKNSIQENDDIIVEEKFYDNQKPEDNDKLNKRYHRRYRSKKVKSNYNNNNIENENNTHKSYTKYRKKHPNY